MNTHTHNWLIMTSYMHHKMITCLHLHTSKTIFYKYLDASFALIERPLTAQNNWSSSCVQCFSELWEANIKSKRIRKTAIHFKIIHSPAGKCLQQWNSKAGLLLAFFWRVYYKGHLSSMLLCAQW